MKIVHHYANGCFDWLISGHRKVNPSREAISILSGKYERFTFVNPVMRIQLKYYFSVDYYFSFRMKQELLIVLVTSL